MKKYHQLLLFVISVISISLFLIYRHEYNRLHYVLEVFNFFGQPCNISNLERTNNILLNHDWGPIPVWQEFDGGYTYSAFLTRQTEVKTIGLLNDDKFMPKSCYFWFEDKKKPVVAKFQFSRIAAGDNVRLSLYFYSCSMASNEHAPYAVSFINKVKRESDLRKIMLTNSYNHRPTINMTICVSPSIYSKRRFIEFLSFHRLLGIESFIFYNRNIPYRLVKIITNLSNRLGLQATFLPWNFPKDDTTLTRFAVESDCLLRTFGHSLYVTTLELNEFIIPVNVYSFNMLTKSFKENSDKVSLPVQKFCIDTIDNTKPISVVNTQVADDSNFNIVRYIHKNAERNENSNLFSGDQGLAVIHKYVKCPTNKPFNSHEDKSILKYSTDLVRSTLFQLLLHSQI